MINAEGSEVWDARPVVDGGGPKAWAKLIFYPKKFALYRYIKEQGTRNPPSLQGYGVASKEQNSFRILDVGCGTGASVIEMKKLFVGAEVVGIDVVNLQIDIARERFSEYGVDARAEWYDGAAIPFLEASFDVVYTSDVLGHVAGVQHWLRELNRVLKPGGSLAMFSESKLGRHAYIRNFLFKRGLNVDPHQEFHISLFSKSELRQLLIDAGFVVEQMYSTVWAKFLVHPDELHEALQKDSRFPILRFFNHILFLLKEKTRPVSLAIAEFYSFVEMYTVGRWVESQGYVILAKKK